MSPLTPFSPQFVANVFFLSFWARTVHSSANVLPHEAKENEMELFNTWMIFNVVTGGAVVAYLTLSSEPVKEMLSKVNYAGVAGAAFGLFSVSAVASLFI
jgi:hypothetical protein